MTKWCMKDGVSKMVCQRWCVCVCVCERWSVTKWCVKWCVTKWCVKEGVSKMVCQRCPARPSPVPKVPRPPPETKVDVTKCHACHMKRRCMSPSATPATRNEGGCHQVPRLPHEIKVHLTKSQPHKVVRRHRRPTTTKRATRASPVP